jgi:hypothetical protein
MDLGALRGRVLAANLLAFGVAVTITRPHPDSTPIETKGIWLTPLHDEEVPATRDYARREPSRVLAIPRAACDTLPRNTFIDAAEAVAGATSRRWQVDKVDRADPDHLRVAVLPVN